MFIVRNYCLILLLYIFFYNFINVTKMYYISILKRYNIYFNFIILFYNLIKLAHLMYVKYKEIVW